MVPLGVVGRNGLVLSWRKHPVETFGGATLSALVFSAQLVVGVILLLSGKLRALQSVGSLIARSKLLMVASCIFVACLLLSVATSVLHALSTLTTSKDAQYNLSEVSGLRKVFALFERFGVTSLNPVGAVSDLDSLIGAVKQRRKEDTYNGAICTSVPTGLKKTSAVIGATVSLAGVVGLSILVIGFYRKFGPGLGVWTGSSVGQKAAFVVGMVGLIVCFASLVGTFCLSLARFYVASRPIFHGSEDNIKLGVMGSKAPNLDDVFSGYSLSDFLSFDTVWRLSYDSIAPNSLYLDPAKPDPPFSEVLDSLGLPEEAHLSFDAHVQERSSIRAQRSSSWEEIQL